MSIIAIEKMKFYAHHGCFEQERTIGTDFEVSVWIHTDTSKAEKTDNVEDTVDYSHIYRVIKQQMDIPSNLLETVARRIIDEIKKQFSKVDTLTVKVCKMNPPVGGQMNCVSVTLRG